MAQFSLDGFAFITGSGSGIGKEIAFTFAEAGAKGIFFADINATAASEAAQLSKTLATAVDFKAISMEVDVANAASVQKAVDRAVEEFGAIDYCVNSAGVDVAAYVPLTETPESDYDRVMAINTKGSFLVTQAVAKVMQKQEPRTLTTKRHGTRQIGRGSIVNIASAMSHGAVPGKLPYVASKHALLGVTRSAALELNRAGIRVNMVCPIWVDTPMFEEESRRTPVVPDLIAKFIPAQRPIGTDEVAAAVQYLCCPAAAYITGTSQMIDNGLSTGPTFAL